MIEPEIAACAALVERGDPDRFLAVMAAPVAARRPLWVLCAFNLELARAPWVTHEPMVAEMRLQWWRDVVGSDQRRAHEVAGPLHDLIRAGLPTWVLDRMVAARRWDVYRDGFADQHAFDDYLDDTGASLMWLGALALGAGAEAEVAVRQFGWAAALAAFLQAVPELLARGRLPLLDDGAEALRDLAREGLRGIARARENRYLVGPGAPALFAGWQAEAVLRQVLADPAAVVAGRLGLSEFQRRGRLLWQGATGRW